MSATGEYLGSVNEEQKLQIVPTTRQELVNLWRDADLSKPADVKE
jgi:hypothetical protein